MYWTNKHLYLTCVCLFICRVSMRVNEFGKQFRRVYCICRYMVQWWRHVAAIGGLASEPTKGCRY